MSRTNSPFPALADRPNGTIVWFLTVIAASALVATLSLLGVEGIATRYAGVPLGLWAIMGVAGLSWVVLCTPSIAGGRSPRTEYSPTDLVLTAAGRGAALIERGSAEPNAEPSSLVLSMQSKLDASPAATLDLRVGLRSDLVNLAPIGEDRPNFHRVRIEQGVEESLRSRRLDALVFEADCRSLIIRTPEHSGLEASWYDWGVDRPVSYFSLFPLRLDCNRVSMHQVAEHELSEQTTRTIRLLSLAAGACSRHPSRLRFSDRLLGRTSALSGPTPLWNGPMLDLCRWLAETTSRGPAERAAARACSAFLATQCDDLSDDERCSLAEATARIAGDEPEVMLRLGAIRLSVFDESLGFDAILRADRMLRDRAMIGGLEHLPILQAELEHGTYADMTLGRVAAGIVLASNAVPADRIAFLKDDLLDEMRTSGWLVGRDKEHAMLIDLFRRLQHARRAEAFGLPPQNTKSARRKPKAAAKPDRAGVIKPAAAQEKPRKSRRRAA